MLPSQKRLSRSDFKEFVDSANSSVVFNNLGTLKYKKSISNKASIVISSKNEKLAVKRNKLRRRIYVLFQVFFKNTTEPGQYILYTSKKTSNLSFDEIKGLFYDLIKKTTK